MMNKWKGGNQEEGGIQTKQVQETKALDFKFSNILHIIIEILIK